MRWILATEALALAGALACTQGERLAPPAFEGAGQPGPRRGGTLRVSIVDDVTSLDPAHCWEEYCLAVEEHIFDSLLGFAPATAPDPVALVPQLAERWSVSPDGRLYTFHIRETARFADGQPVLAEDFVTAFERILDPAVSSPGAGLYGGILGAAARLEGKAPRVAGLRAPAARVLEIELEKPDAAFPQLLALKFATPVRAAHLARVGEHVRDAPLATGPFVLRRWVEGEKLVLARNDAYWDPALPYLDAIELLVLVPRDVSVMKFLRGELDAVERMNPDDHARFARTPEWRPYLALTARMDTFAEAMNVTRPPFSDRRVRQAFNLAVRKEDTVRLYGGRAVVAKGMLPPSLVGPDADRLPLPYDPGRARRLLAEAGYPDGFEVTYATTQDVMAQRVAQSIQADLAEVGVRVRIETLTGPAFVAASGRGEFDFAYTGWFADYPDPSNFLEPRFHSRFLAPESSTNDSRYANPEFDRLLDEARVEQDAGRRRALYRRAEDILREDCPYVWHYHTVSVQVRHPYVMGYVPHPLWLRDYRHTWLDEPRRAR